MMPLIVTLPELFLTRPKQLKCLLKKIFLIPVYNDWQSLNLPLGII